MMNSNFLVVAYKPDSVDVCRQCVMDRYSSDYESTLCDSEAALRDVLSQYKNKNSNLRIGEDRYQLDIFAVINGKIEQLSEDSYPLMIYNSNELDDCMDENEDVYDWTKKLLVECK